MLYPIEPLIGGLILCIFHMTHSQTSIEPLIGGLIRLKLTILPLLRLISSIEPLIGGLIHNCGLDFYSLHSTIEPLIGGLIRFVKQNRIYCDY